MYIAAKASSSLINARSLLDKSFFLISLAFYEPVHYCVIISKADIPTCSTFSSNSGKQMIEGARRKLHSSSTLNACYFNTRGVCNKLNELNNLLNGVYLQSSYNVNVLMKNK